MGRMLVQALDNHPQAQLVAACERQGTNFIGQDVGELAGVGTANVTLFANGFSHER